MPTLINQKEFLQENVDRIEAKKGGPTTYTKLIRKQIASMEAGEPIPSDEYVVSLIAGKDG